MECFDVQSQDPKKREAPGICPVCPVVNPALAVTQIKASIMSYYPQ